MIGEGGSGTVHLARRTDENPASALVVKRLHASLERHPEIVRRFSHEAALAVSIDDPHVAAVYDVGAVAGAPYIAMEYVPGLQLRRLLKDMATRDVRPPLAAAAYVVEGALAGLSALHTARHPQTGDRLEAVHRDMSPNNLMIDLGGCTRVIDLGIGKSKAQDWQTRPGAVMGSLGYMSPEQVRGEPVDHRSDLYSVGVLFWELLTVQAYVPRGPRDEMMRTTAEPTYLRARTLRPEVPPALDDLLGWMLAPDPNGRPGSAREALDAIRGTLTSSSAQLLALIEGAFGDELKRRAERVEALLDAPFEPEVEPPAEDTVLYARRPTLVRVTNTHVAATHLSPNLDARPAAVAFDPPAAAVQVADRRGRFALGFTAMILAISAVALAFALRQPPAAVVAPPSPATRAPAVTARPWAADPTPSVGTPVVATARETRSDDPSSALAGPAVAAPHPDRGTSPPLEVRTSPPEAEARPPKNRARRAPRGAEISPAPPEPRPIEAIPDTVARLSRRAQSLRAARPDLADRLDELLTDVSLWSSASDRKRAAIALDELESKLAALERARAEP